MCTDRRDTGNPSHGGGGENERGIDGRRGAVLPTPSRPARRGQSTRRSEIRRGGLWEIKKREKREVSDREGADNTHETIVKILQNRLISKKEGGTEFFFVLWEKSA